MRRLVAAERVLQVILIATFAANLGFGGMSEVALPALGRVMGALMLAAVGTFPVSVLLAGLVVHELGPAAFFPLTAVVLAATITWALTQPSWREFGTPDASPTP